MAKSSSVQADVTYTISGLTAEGDRVAAEVECSANTPAGPFHNRYHVLFELRDGLIVVAKKYADSLYRHMFSKRAENAGSALSA